MVISSDQPLLESIFLNKYPIPTKPKSETSPWDLLDLPNLADMLIMKNSSGIVVAHSDESPCIKTFPFWKKEMAKVYACTSF